MTQLNQQFFGCTEVRRATRWGLTGLNRSMANVLFAVFTRCASTHFTVISDRNTIATNIELSV
jgi:hypothetical protein